MIGKFAGLLLVASLLASEGWATVRAGADRLDEPAFHQLLAGRRLGVLAHAASRLSTGVHLVDALHRGYDLRAIFAPEHGFRGSADEPVGDSRDPATGLPVFSLYGPRVAPTAQELSLIDVMVIDLADVAVRFYTYPATMARVLAACARAHKPVVLLDRPDVAARFAEGAMLDPRWAGSSVSFYSTTTVHGLTLGELARLFNEQLRIGADLTVVPVSNWRRDERWADTGLAWTPPSPALTTSEQALLYAVLGPLESLNIAVGRGIDNRDAFRVYGAPWITEAQARELAARLTAAALPGISFTATSWVPTRREFQGKLCRGFRVTITDERRLEPFRSLVTVLRELSAVLRGALIASGADRSIGLSWVRQAAVRGDAVDSIVARARREAEAFLALRARYLAY